MFRQLGLLCTALAVFSIAGGPWGVLQTVAWARMLHDYRHRSGSIASAVGQTFDGQHPCELCRAIEIAKSREHRQKAATSKADDEVKIKASLAGSHLPAFARQPAGISLLDAVLALDAGRTEPPPTPPPRCGNLAA